MKMKDIYENTIVMLYIIVLTITTAVIILYSKDIYTDVKVYSEDFKELEVAMSYINVKVRQKDKIDVISIKTVKETDDVAIVFTEGNKSIWVYKNQNMLVETETEKNKQPNLESFIKIADITDFNVKMKDGLLKYSITVQNYLEESTAINIRSQN